MDINNLTDAEVKELIEAEKNPTNILDYQEVYNDITTSMVYSSHSYRCEVQDRVRGILYNLNVHTTPIETHFSIGLMLKENHIHLIRFDFGENLRHTNDLNTDHPYDVIGSHVHINSPASKYEPKNVISVGEIDEFANLKTIKEAFMEFIEYTNIQTKD